jgi:hypothetical protein
MDDERESIWYDEDYEPRYGLSIMQCYRYLIIQFAFGVDGVCVNNVQLPKI